MPNRNAYFRSYSKQPHRRAYHRRYMAAYRDDMRSLRLAVRAAGGSDYHK